MRRATRERSFGPAVCLAALILALAAPAIAQVTIQQGIDVLVSAPGTMATVDVPADFFCPGSAAINTIVAMQGVPLTTNPPHAIDPADTVVERLKDAALTPGACVTVPAVVRAVSLESVPGQELAVFCPAVGDTRWKVTACTCGCCGVQPITRLTLCDDGTGQACGQTCGTFSGDLKLDVCLRFTNIDDWTVLGPVQDQVTLNVNTTFCDTNPGGVAEFKDALMIDTNCDGQSNLAVPCTTNFFPGSTCPPPPPPPGGGLPKPPPFCHEGPRHQHCVGPVCAEKPVVLEEPVLKSSS